MGGKYHLQGVYIGKYHSKEWVNTTHKDDKISFTGVYTGKYHSRGVSKYNSDGW